MMPKGSEWIAAALAMRFNPYAIGVMVRDEEYSPYLIAVSMKHELKTLPIEIYIQFPRTYHWREITQVVGLHLNAQLVGG